LALQIWELNTIEKEQELNSNASDNDMPFMMSGKSSDDSIDQEGRQQLEIWKGGNHKMRLEMSLEMRLMGGNEVGGIPALNGQSIPITQIQLKDLMYLICFTGQGVTVQMEAQAVQALDIFQDLLRES
jgi:hypothetical protein